jgi:hypothetical protein
MSEDGQQVVAQWLNSPLGRVGLRFESQLCFFLPTTRHQEIQVWAMLSTRVEEGLGFEPR